MAKFAKKLTFFAQGIYTFYEQKFSNLRAHLSISFPKGFQKSKKFEHWTLANGGKKTFKQREPLKKICKKLFGCGDLTPFLNIFFLQI